MIRIFLLLITFILPGCNDMQVPIEPDDFGYPKVVVSASGYNITGTQVNELSEWLSTGYKYNGDPLVIMVYNNGNGLSSQWTSWFGENEPTVSSAMLGASLCNIASPNTGDTEVTFTDPTQPPCIFAQGQGLYMLLTNPASTVTDPNSSATINRNPSTPSANFATLQLSQSIPLYSQGAQAGGYYGDFTNSSTYVNGRAYFKILDKYYDDNSGTYYLALKRGFNSLVTPPIAYTINVMTTKLNTTAQTIYNNIISNSEYLTAMQAILVLYIVIHGILYLGGMLHMSDKELIIMFFKLAVVLQLFTASSWQFFDTYLFEFFTSGLTEVLDIITSTFTSGTIGSLTFFDQFLSLLYSYETGVKILALIVSVPSGIVVAGMLGIAFAIFTVAIIQAVILYLLALLATSILILLGPVFIPFLLFKTTRSLFEGWINQFANYFFQPIMVFACITIFGQMIITQIYRILGFGTCYDDYLVVNVNGSRFVLLKAWQICPFNTSSSLLETIAVPGYWMDSNQFCEPYECQANRYIDLPYLDPVADASLIQAFQDPWNQLNIPMLYNTAILVLMCYLMTKLNGLIPSVAKHIAGTSAHGSDLMTGIKSSMGREFTTNKERTLPTFEGATPTLDKLTGSDKKSRQKFIENTKKVIQENKYFKVVGTVAHYTIPPLSLSIESKEDMQREAWNKNPNNPANIAKSVVTGYINKIQDAVGGTIDKAFAAMKGQVPEQGATPGQGPTPGHEPAPRQNQDAEPTGTTNSSQQADNTNRRVGRTSTTNTGLTPDSTPDDENDTFNPMRPATTITPLTLNQNDDDNLSLNSMQSEEAATQVAPAKRSVKDMSEEEKVAMRESLMGRRTEPLPNRVGSAAKPVAPTKPSKPARRAQDDGSGTTTARSRANPKLTNKES